MKNTLENTLKTTTQYINNDDFLKALIDYKTALSEALEKNEKKPRIPNYIGECFLKIASNLAKRPNFCCYTYKDEMVSDAIENCFHRSTKVLTIEHGPIEIEKILGEEVTIKTKDGQWRNAIVKSYGRQMLYEYGFAAFNVGEESVFQKVIATSNHRWFVSSRRNSRGLLEHAPQVVTDLRIGDALENAPFIDGMDNIAVIHGIIFGDGSGHKSQVFNDPVATKQGNKYAFIRVCKQDKVKDIIVDILTKAGYQAKYPPHSNGDPIFHIGKFPFVKDVPFSNDPSYIAGFIYGWWLADGNKTTYSKRKQITTSNKAAVDWLVDYAAFGGYQVTGVHKKERKDGDGSFANGKVLYTIYLANSDQYEPKVRYIKEFGEDEVFCLEEPVTNSFVLGNGLLTGNCLMYFENFDPAKSSNPFAYFTQICWYAFVRRIAKEKKQQYVKYKATENFGILDEEELMELGDGTINQIQIYDNLYEFISDYEENIERKKESVKNKKGLEKFLD